MRVPDYFRHLSMAFYTLKIKNLNQNNAFCYYD